MADRDWGGLRAVMDAAAEDRRREAAKAPVACPHCGEPLDVRGSERNCPAGDFYWNGAMG